MMPWTELLASILDAGDVPYILNVEPGGHSYAYWSSNLDMYLLFFGEDWQE